MAKKSSHYSPTRGRFKGRKFPSKGAYRNALARAKGFKSEHVRRRSRVRVSSQKDIERLSVISREKRNDSLEVLSLMRRGKLSLAKAIKGFNQENPSQKISSDTVIKYMQQALAKKGGRWQAKRYDRLLRLMRIPTTEGAQLIEVHDSRTASRLGQYHSALGEYLATGDESILLPFRGKEIVSRRQRYRLITDPELIEQLADVGELQFESIYEVPHP